MTVRARRPAATVTFLTAIALAVLPFGGPAEARFNPLLSWTQQIQKSNILFLLDTSGSMAGTPGGNFNANSEVGVDCENGVRCRQVSNAGMCSQSTLFCSADRDCRAGACEDGGDPCFNDLDCPQSGARCSLSNRVCQFNSDCDPSYGSCSIGSLNGDGLTVTYFDNMDLTLPRVTRTETTVDFNWGSGSPDATVGADTFSARFTGFVAPRTSESFTFCTATDDGVRLWVNNQLVIDKWINQGETRWCSAPIALQAYRKVPIRLEYYDDGAQAVVRLLWSSASTPETVVPQWALFTTLTDGDGLNAIYYDNMDFTGTTVSRTDPTIDFDWGENAPVAGIDADTFSVRWTGLIAAGVSESFTFCAVADDGVRLWVNNQLLIDRWIDQAATEHCSAPIPLTAFEKVPIQLEYYDNPRHAVIRLFWSSPSTPKAIVPQRALYTGVTGGGDSCSSVQACPQAYCSAFPVACNSPGSSCGNLCAGTGTACSAYTDCDAAGNVTTGLLGYWKFDGNYSDSSGNGNTASAGNATSTTTNAGYLGGAGVATGDGFFSVPDTSNIWDSITNQSGFTYGAWFMLTENVIRSFHNLGSRQQGNANNEFWNLLLRNRRYLNFKGLEWDYGTEVPLNQWFHAAVTFSNGTGRLYWNGQLVRAGSVSVTFSADTTPVIIANNKNSGSSYGECLGGRIDEVRIYNRALSGEEIARISKRCVSGGQCNAVNNFCSAALNVCRTGVGGNRCIVPNPTDTCGSSGGTAGPIRMCELEMVRCATDNDCRRIAGDRCIPATSRAVMAKRALSSVLARNVGVANFGLMTFRQEGYFPYYPIKTGTVKNITETMFMTKDVLLYYNCFSGNAGPVGTCSQRGVSFVLRPTGNSRYRVHSDPDNYITVDRAWCGLTCQTAQGLGVYDGSYYNYTVQTADPDEKATPVIRSTFDGKMILIGGKQHVYFEPKTNYNADPESGVNRPAIKADVNCSGRDPCSQTCGARWDTQLSPFIDPTGANASTVVDTLLNRLNRAWYGGLMFWGRTPIGCALKNDGAPTENFSAYHYMQKLKTSDSLGCRQNAVILVTDGEPNGPGDIDTGGRGNCNNPDCGSDNPAVIKANCRCRSVLSALAMKEELNVKTYVVGFAGDIASGNGRAVQDYIAKAGGTGKAFIAFNELTLANSIQAAIYEIVKGSYQTSPPSVASALPGENGVQTGSLVIDARVDFPSWAGHLNVYNLETGVAWDAATVAFPNECNPAPCQWWKYRRVYTSKGSDLVRIQVDPNTGAILNRTELNGLGLGTKDNFDETERIARWMLGDPAMKNPAVLGALVNSSPIDVGPPGLSKLPGGKTFYELHKNRPNLIYVGSSNGFLHAFFTYDTAIGATTYKGGSEAFAYVPPEMFGNITRIFAQGGQLAAPQDHIFGLASSPKVKSVCVANCTSDLLADWRTLLVMTQGPGGNDMFVLDITNPFLPGGGIKNPPVSLMWHTNLTSQSTWDSSLGQTFSVPAFYFAKTDNTDDERLIFVSGYQIDSTKANQGRTLISAQTRNGTILDSKTINAPPGACAGNPEYTALTDVGTARNYNVGEKAQILSAYFGDTWGNLWRYQPAVLAGGNTGTTGTLSTVTSLGCQHPLHFMPAVVQLDRDFPTNHSGEIYLVQVTNSALDPDTRAFQPSRLVIRKEKASGGNVTADTTFGTSGAVTLTVGTNDICIGDPCTPLPTSARPLSTPMAILKSDGHGFLVFAVWYVGAACSRGETYLTVHDVLASGQVTQRAGMHLASEPVAGVVVVGGKLVYIESGGGLKEIPAGSLGITLQEGGKAGQGNAGDGAFRASAWKETP